MQVYFHKACYNIYIYISHWNLIHKLIGVAWNVAHISSFGSQGILTPKANLIKYNKLDNDSHNNNPIT